MDHAPDGVHNVERGVPVKKMSEWKKEDLQSLRAVEKEARMEIDDMDPFAVSFDSKDDHQDDRDYVDQMFKDFSIVSGIVPKKVQGYKCENNIVPKLEAGTLAVLFDYKILRTQGKRDPLAGNHVLVIPTPIGPHMLPLHLARNYALNILKLIDVVEDKVAESGMSMEPSTDDHH